MVVKFVWNASGIQSLNNVTEIPDNLSFFTNGTVEMTLLKWTMKYLDICSCSTDEPLVVLNRWSSRDRRVSTVRPRRRLERKLMRTITTRTVTRASTACASSRTWAVCATTSSRCAPTGGSWRRRASRWTGSGSTTSWRKQVGVCAGDSRLLRCACDVLAASHLMQSYGTFNFVYFVQMQFGSSPLHKYMLVNLHLRSFDCSIEFSLGSYDY